MKNALKKKLPAILLLLILLPDASQANVKLQADQLLGYFASGCTTQREWTQAAQSYTRNLVDTLTSVAADPDCKTLNAGLSQLDVMDVALSNLNQDLNQRKMASLKQQEQQLLLMIAQVDPSNTTLISTLMSQLRTIQLSISESQSHQISDAQFRLLLRQGTAMDTLVAGTNSLLQQAAANELCTLKHPSILSGIAGLASTISAISMTSGTSLIVAAGASIMNGVIEKARVAHLNHKINKMASPLNDSAYQCALETLSNQWCSAQDAFEITELKAGTLTQKARPVPSTFDEGLALLSVDTNKFLNWLVSLRAGTPPANQPMANLQATQVDRDGMIRKGRIIGQGFINHQQPNFDDISRSSDPAPVKLENQWALVKSVIGQINIFFTTPQNSVQSPMYDFFGGSIAAQKGPWFLLGVDDINTPIPRDQNTNAIRQLDTYRYKDIVKVIPNYIPSLESLSTYMNSWVDQASVRVTNEMSRNLNLDPDKLLYDAATADQSGRSPHRSLVKIIRFMERNRRNVGTVGSTVPLFDDTIVRLKKIACHIESITAHNYPRSRYCSGIAQLPDSQTALGEIVSAGVLINGSGFISDRIRWAIRLLLIHELTSGRSGVNSAQAALLLVQNDITSEMLDYPDLNLSARDIKKSQVIIETTLANFVDQYKKGIAKTAKGYLEHARMMGETGKTGKTNEELSELCLKLLSIPVWPSTVPTSICIGRNLPSIFANAPPSQTITEALIRKPFEQRVCTFRNYNRANTLFQAINRQL